MVNTNKVSLKIGQYTMAVVTSDNDDHNGDNDDHDNDNDENDDNTQRSLTRP